MRKLFIISGLCLSLLAAGCRHKNTAVVPSVQAPLPAEEPEQPPTEAQNTQPAAKLPQPAPTPPQQQTTTPPPPKRKKAKPSPATPATDTTQAAAAPAPAAQQQTASIPAPGGASAIGQLSEGGPAASGDLRNQTIDLIASVDRKLKGITRPLSGQEQRTVSQVRKFLQQATDALHNQDVDAAHTLATKANVLLDELLK